MDIRWKDGAGNILNANNEKLKYLTCGNEKTILKKDEIKKITIEDGLMNVFKDFHNDLAVSIVIPKGHKRDAVKIFNQYDKTGTILKRNSGNFFVDLILDSSIVTFNPFTGIAVILAAIIFLFAILITLPVSIFGDEIGLLMSRVSIIGAIGYIITSYALLRFKRKKLKENY